MDSELVCRLVCELVCKLVCELVWMLLSVSLLPADELLRKGRVLERESGVLLPPLPGESRGKAKEVDFEESGELGLLLLHLLPNNLGETDRS